MIDIDVPGPPLPGFVFPPLTERSTLPECLLHFTHVLIALFWSLGKALQDDRLEISRDVIHELTRR